MVRAYHVIFGAYGFWLPNDPRGSWSDFVWAGHLQRFGDVVAVSTRRSVASREHDRELRLAAKAALQFPEVRFDEAQIDAIGRAFGGAAREFGLIVRGCAVMPDHVHLVTMRFDEAIEWVAGYLKRAASRELTRVGIHPQAGHQDRRGRTPTPWAEGGWFVYLNNDDEIRRSAGYTRANPRKAGLPDQPWDFVV